MASPPAHQGSGLVSGKIAGGSGLAAAATMATAAAALAACPLAGSPRIPAGCLAWMPASMSGPGTVLPGAPVTGRHGLAGVVAGTASLR